MFIIIFYMPGEALLQTVVYKFILVDDRLSNFKNGQSNF